MAKKTCRTIVKTKRDYYGDGWNATYPKIITQLSEITSARTFGTLLHIDGADPDGKKITVQISKRSAAGKKILPFMQDQQITSGKANVEGTKWFWETKLSTKPFKGLWISGKGATNAFNEIEIKNPRIITDKMPPCKERKLTFL